MQAATLVRTDYKIDVDRKELEEEEFQKKFKAGEFANFVTVPVMNGSVQLEKKEQPKIEEEEDDSDKKVTYYSAFVLILLFLMRIAMNWQRKSLSYIYGFKGIGLQAGDATFEILQQYP